MGREAVCTCVWKNQRHRVKAMLEPPELIIRGEIHRRIPFAKIENIRADGDNLRLAFEDDSVCLQLGSAVAAKWAEAMLKPPPSLAKKLGILTGITVCVIGHADASALAAALAEAKAVSKSKGDLILARVDTPADLSAALRKAASQLADGIPIWFIYPKGPGHPLNENMVRSIALATGIVDTKIASVSKELSALRFVKRRS